MIAARVASLLGGVVALGNRMEVVRMSRSCTAADAGPRTIVALSVFLVVGVVHGVGARELGVSFSPPFATWKDEVVVTVAGVVETACGPEIMDLVYNPTSYGHDIVLDLVESPCGSEGAATPQPFGVSMALPLFSPSHDTDPLGGYTIQVRDVADGTITTSTLRRYQVFPGDLIVPTDARSGEEVRLTVRGLSQCLFAPVPFPQPMDDHILLSLLSFPCSSPGERVYETTFSIASLAPGDYPIYLFDAQFRLLRSSLRVWDAAGCVPSDIELCLGNGRFRLTVHWAAFDGSTGQGHPIPLRDDSGLFWFFDPANVELTVKVLDGCGLNERYWVFVSSGSTVEYDLTVTDTHTGLSRPYGNALGAVPDLIADTDAFATCP